MAAVYRRRGREEVIIPLSWYAWTVLDELINIDDAGQFVT